MSVNDIPREFLWCRDVLHAWDNYDAKVSRSRITRRNEIHQVLLCTRCGTLKTRFLSTSGETLRGPSYSYPDGYLLTEHGPMTPADRATIRTLNLRASGKLDADGGAS